MANRSSITPKGPSKLAKATWLDELDENGKKVGVRYRRGYDGKKGWRYHPTKGFRKDATHVPYAM